MINPKSLQEKNSINTESKKSTLDPTSAALNAVILKQFSSLPQLYNNVEKKLQEKTPLLSYEKLHAVENQTLIETETKKIVAGWSIKKIALLTACMSGAALSLYSGFVYMSSGEDAGKQMGEQIIELLKKLGATSENVGTYLAIIFSHMVEWGGVVANSFLNTQTYVMLTTMIYRQYNRDDAEKFLTGDINFMPWMLGGIVGLGPIIPSAYLSITKATSSVIKTNSYLAAAANSIPNSVGGFKLFNQLSGLSRFFSETHDDSEVDKILKPGLKIARSIFAAKSAEFASNILFLYIKKKRFPSEMGQFIAAFNKLKQGNVDPANLVEGISILSNAPASDIESSSGLIKAIKKSGKGTLTGTLVVSCVIMLANNILAAFYAGKSLSDRQIRYGIGAMCALLTGMSTSGLTSFSVKGLLGKIWHGDFNAISSLNKAAYLPLATVMIIIGIFSGGTSGILGLTQFQKLLGKSELATGVSQFMEAGGYLGSAAFNTSYCIGLAEWLLEQHALYVSKDPEMRLVVALPMACQAVSHTISNTKLEHIHSLIKSGVFPVDSLPENLKNTFKADTEQNSEITIDVKSNFYA